MPSKSKLADRIARTRTLLGQLTEQQKLADRRAAQKAKDDARRADAHRKIELGGLVIAAGLAEWDPAELVGLLLKGAERVAQSPDARLILKRAGLEHLQTRAASRGSS